MNPKRIAFVLSAVIFSLLLILLPVKTEAQQDKPQVSEAVGAPVGTAFTYQGRLTVSGMPANGSYNFRFNLWDDASKTTWLGSYPPSGFIAIQIVDGYFTAVLDFGFGLFDGGERWLEIDVNGTLLEPLQRITSTPYAIYAQTAPWSGLVDVPPGFSDGVDNDTTAFWGLSGNSGTNPSTYYVGTSDNQTMVLRVNAVHALRLEPTSGTPNLIGGSSNNTVTAGTLGATISGGGAATAYNIVTDNYGTVGGGSGNRAGDHAGVTDDNPYATVAGGTYNIADDWASTVCGGQGNTASGYISTIGGGYENIVAGDYSTVGGGANNNASGYVSTIGGGLANKATGDYSTVSGGQNNTASGYISTIGGGSMNSVYSAYATVGGGYSNSSSGSYSTLSGGEYNTASGDFSTVGGGYSNSASGYSSTVGGGSLNSASGDYSFAAGRYAKANNAGSFVWADAFGQDFNDTGLNTFNIRAGNGTYIQANNSNVGLTVNNSTMDWNGDGIRSYADTSKGDAWAAVYALNNGTSPGVFASSYGTYAGYFNGAIYATSCVGCSLIQLGQNNSTNILQPGDLVAVSGLGEALVNNSQPILNVHRATAGEAVIGVVQSRGVRTESTKDGNTFESIDSTDGDIQPGDYLFLVVYGPALVKADASSASITPGIWLTAGESGFASTLQTRTIEGMVVSEAASNVGIALEPLESGTGLILVFVTLH